MSIVFNTKSYKLVMLNPVNFDYDAHLSDISKASKIAIDIETFDAEGGNKGLHPWQCAIRLIQIYTGGDTVYVADLGARDTSHETPLLALSGFGVSDRPDRIKSLSKFFDMLKGLCSRAEAIGHNIHYDALRLALLHDVWIEHPICTMLGGYVFFGDYGKKEDDKAYQPVLKGGYGLKNMVKTWLNLDLDKTEQFSNWGGNLTQSQIEYACLDVIAVWQLESKLRQQYRSKKSSLYSPTIEKIWDLENAVIPVTVEMELTGCPVDLPLLQQYKNELETHKDNLFKQWNKLTDIGYNQTAKLQAEINKTLPPDKQLDCLDKAALSTCDHPLVNLRLQIKALDALLNNLNQFQRSTELCNDGRLHTQFRTLSGFGRFTCGGGKFKDLPNMQSISAKSNPHIKHLNTPNVREVIKAPNGYKMLIVDLAGAHGRIAADQANDPVAIAGNNDTSIDNHSKVAVYVARSQGVDTDWLTIQKKNEKKEAPYKGWRDTAKNTYYGWLNGGGAARIQQQIAANTGHKPELEACEAAIEGCKQLYPGVLKFRANLMYKLKATAVEVCGIRYARNEISDGSRLLLAMEHSKYSDALEPPYTRSLASIWTRIEATAMKKALIKIRRERKPEWDLQIMLTVHDEIDFLVKEEYALVAAEWVSNLIGDCFAEQLTYVHDGRETEYKKLICNSWADK